MRLRAVTLFASIVLGTAIGACFSRSASGQQVALAAQWAEILSHMSIVYLEDGRGGQAKTIRLTGVNLQVVNGLDATNGYPADPGTIDPALTRTNGTGNIIVGYPPVAG